MNEEQAIPVVERFKMVFPTLQVDWEVGNRVFSPVEDPSSPNKIIEFPGSGVVLEIVPHPSNKVTVVHIQYSYTKYINMKGEVVRLDTTDYLEGK